MVQDGDTEPVSRHPKLFTALLRRDPGETSASCLPRRESTYANPRSALSELSDASLCSWPSTRSQSTSEVGALTPLASKDIDFEAAHALVRRAAELLAARMRLVSMDDHTPNTGIVLF